MTNLSSAQVGSVVLNMVENVPSTISGTTLTNMAENEVYFAESITGASIGITAIGTTYQPAIISLTAASVLRMMEMVGADVSNMKLGDFSVSKGTNSSSSSAADKLREDGIRKLEALGNVSEFYKALG